MHWNITRLTITLWALKPLKLYVFCVFYIFGCLYFLCVFDINEPRHEISNNVVCATSKGSDQPAHTCRLIRAFACRLSILWVLSYWPNFIWSFYAWKEAAQARLSLHLSKCHIVANHMPRLKFFDCYQTRQKVKWRHAYPTGPTRVTSCFFSRPSMWLSIRAILLSLQWRIGNIGQGYHIKVYNLSMWKNIM